MFLIICLNKLINQYVHYNLLFLVNLSNIPVTIDIGDKIAQMLIVPVPKVDIVQVDELQNTDRGNAGFGSTG